ncbi:PIN domain-containing protein [Pantoea sp. GL120224-02]|uniref:PIN domain-containing protein n=1 Tax=Pantoea sp. GL120224-02 TaxID=1378084 RepID=UPI000BD9D08A|nr:PIN domain-containing protein [Pantoea sp. GL120224-02]SNY71894.1 PIN domain-containing protein [Pantoea sp. GL120224-02]
MTHSPYPVVLDACVIYPNMLRDLLMRLELSGLYMPKWTATIHDEWQRNLVKNMPEVTPDKVKRIEVLMDKALPDALVTGFEPLISGLSLPDEDDRHVVAAAIKCNAEVIVTFNLKDFPGENLDALEIEAMHPDEFILDLIDLNRALVLKAVREQRTSLKNPAIGSEEYLTSLLKLGLPMTVRALEAYSFMI